MQALLLRFLENGEIQAVGSDESAGARRRSRGRRDQSQSERSGRRRPVPRGPALSAAGHPSARAASSRAARRRPGADDSTFSPVPNGRWSFTDEALRALRAIPLAGQRPRTAECRRTAGLAVDDRSSSASSISRWRCATRPAPLKPLVDRRRQVADDLYDALVKQGASFWEHVYPMFLARDITRHDLRELVRRGLRESARPLQVAAQAVWHAEQ